jgi:hypothetical protein
VQNTPTPKPLSCTDPCYIVIDQGLNELGANRCKTDCDCDGARTCSRSRWCQGTSRPANHNCG